MKRAKELLKSVFGYAEFRENQEKIINLVLNKQDVVAVMPTGSGKSLCYQIPSLIFEGLTIVVSPLISLMKDQVMQLDKTGVNAVYLNSTLFEDEYSNNMDLIRKKKVKLLYVAPETLLQSRIIEFLRNVKIDLLAIDEAHCISEWGHDFRPEYRQLITIKNEFPKVTTLALTATATPQVQKDILRNLKLDNTNLIVASFDRKNLLLEVLPKTNAFEKTIQFIEKFPKQSGLIYCFSRKQVDNLTEGLSKLGFSVLPYHAGLSDGERYQNQEAFIRDDVQIIVATIAFGMGINKPDIRFVLHYDLPKNIESYYQQIGRAGRDGEESHCCLLFSYADVSKIKYFINDKQGKDKQIAYDLLNAMIHFCETDKCRRISLLSYFGEVYLKDNCNKCDVCLNPPKSKQDLTEEVQKFLSCVYRTEELFGVAYIVKVLRGSKEKRILENNHDKITTYGIGMGLSSKQWNHLARQLLRAEIIKTGEFGSLKLTSEALSILKNQEKFMGNLIEEKVKIESSEVKDYNSELFEILRNLRKEIADEERVPPYVIFADRTLKEISRYFPQKQESLIRIHGVGTRKVERYGEQFLRYINKFCLENDLVDQTEQLKSNRKIRRLKPKKHEIVGKMFNDGFSIQEISLTTNTKINRLIQLLTDFINDGNVIHESLDLGLEFNINENDLNVLFSTFNTIGIAYLKPIFEATGGKYNYDQLRYARLCYIIEN